jgi:transposase
VRSLPLAHFALDDRIGEAHAMVALVSQGHALQTEVAEAFGCDVRTVRRNLRRFEGGGLAALGRPRGYPAGRARTPASQRSLLQRWKGEGLSNRQIAARLGVTEKAVRNLAKSLGWPARVPQQAELSLPAADSKLSGPAPTPADGPQPHDSHPSPQRASSPGETQRERAASPADPKLSGPDADEGDGFALSFDSDPADRSADRILAALGLLDDAAPLFGSASHVAGAGVLLALPALIESGVLTVARQVYGSLAPAFYGLRTTFVTLLLMALLRIKRPEALKEQSPQQLGQLLGLDRAPEVKTLRKKLTRLAAFGRAASFGRALAEHRVARRGEAMGFLYVDGHVRVYHGKRSLPKTHVTRMRISMPASTDYWVNDAGGEPLFVLPTEANKAMVKTLPLVLEEVRRLVGTRRVTVVFDRGGWSPKLFVQILDAGFDILTYRKGRWRRVPAQRFRRHEATLGGEQVQYQLADQDVLLLGRKLRLRQVTRLSEDGHQTPIITSRRDLSAAEVAYRMFARWRQENFFKYLREEYALDCLVDYGVESADETRLVPNPRRLKLDADLRKARAQLEQVVAEYGLEAFENHEELRRTMRGFKIANASMGRRVLDALQRVSSIEKKRAAVPLRVPVREVVHGEVVKLAADRKHLTDLLKMVAYQAESELVRLVAPHFERSEDEGRTLIQNALALHGDIAVSDDHLEIQLEPLSSPHRTRALAALCQAVNATRTTFPGSKLRLKFTVKPEPSTSMAFPGARTVAVETAPQPDIFGRG